MKKLKVLWGKIRSFWGTNPPGINIPSISEESWETIGEFYASVSLGGTGEVATSSVTVRVCKLTGKIQHKVVPRSDPDFYGEKFMDDWEFDYPEDMNKKIEEIKISIRRNDNINLILE